jgi:hypothetical protein
MLFSLRDFLLALCFSLSGICPVKMMNPTHFLMLWYSPKACSMAPHILLCEAKLKFQLVLARVDMAQYKQFTGEHKALNPKNQYQCSKRPRNHRRGSGDHDRHLICGT